LENCDITPKKTPVNFTGSPKSYLQYGFSQSEKEKK